MERVDFARRYAEWVREHPDRAKRVEEVLRLVSFVSRMRGSMPLSEIAYSMVSLLGVVNESILNPGLTRAMTAPARRIRAPLKWTLTALNSTDVVLEMALENTPLRSLAVFLIEFFRMAARLYLLHMSRGRMLLQGGSLFYEDKDTEGGRALVADDVAGLEGPPAGPGATSAPKQEEKVLQWRGKRSGRTVRVPAGWRTERVVAASSVHPPRTGAAAAGLRPAAGAAQWAAEVMHIARPFLHLILRRARGDKAWSPWVVSLAVEAASAQLSRFAVAQRAAYGGGGGATAAETRELSRRRTGFAYYLLRDPVFGSLTEPAAERTVAALGAVPLLGFAVRYLLAMLRYLKRYHFYTSASS